MQCSVAAEEHPKHLPWWWVGDDAVGMEVAVGRVGSCVHV